MEFSAPDSRARSRTQKIAGSKWHSRRVGFCRKLASTPKALRQGPITVRLGTDSVNPFRQQIYKSFVSVALKPHTAKPSADECDFLFDQTSQAAGSGVNQPRRSDVRKK